MSKKTTTQGDMDLLDEWERAKAAGITKHEFAKLKGQSYPTIHTRIYRARKGFKNSPDLFDFGVEERLLIEEEDVMVIGDLHLPFTDYTFATLPAMIGDKYMTYPRKLIIAGDAFNFDTYSIYDKICILPKLSDEKAAGQHMFEIYLDTFQEIVFLMGNHERRLQKWMKGEYDASDIAMLLSNSGKVKTTNYGWIVLRNSTGDWRITHSKCYSVNQLTVASDLANKFQMNILTNHDHHLAMGWDRYKRYVTINNGCLVDDTKIPYVNMDDNRMANMTQGFTMFKNGHPTVFGKEPFTDWNKWMQ
jgi:hypothetical protein